jgi:hypothetical protein
VSDEAIQLFALLHDGLLRFIRNDNTTVMRRLDRGIQYAVTTA